MIEFFQKYVINPIQYGGGYNIYNTFIFAVSFVFFSDYIFRILKKTNSVRKLPKMILPYILFGAILRSLEDANAVTRTFITVTPGIYIFTSVIFLIFLFLGSICKKTQTITALFGWLSVFFLLTKFPVFSIIPLLKAMMLFGFFWLFVDSIFGSSKYGVKSKFSKMWASHLFEAATTITAIQFYGFFEQHVLASKVIELTGTPFSFFLLKLTVIPFVFYLMSGLDKDEFIFTREVIFFLGLGPGLRNILSVMFSI